MNFMLSSWLFLTIFKVHWSFLDPKNVSLIQQLGRCPACRVRAIHGRSSFDPTALVILTEQEQVTLLTLGQNLRNDYMHKLTSVSHHQFQFCTTEIAVVSLVSLLRVWDVKYTYLIMDTTAGLSKEDVSRYFTSISLSADIHSIADVSAVNLQQLLTSLAQHQNEHTYISILANVTNSLSLIKLAEQLQLFKMEKFFWIFVLTTEDVYSWHDIGLTVSSSFQLTTLQLTIGREAMVEIHDVFYNILTSKMDSLKIGRWTYAKGTEFFRNRNEISSEHGLKGRVFRFSGIQDVPLAMLDNASSTTLKHIGNLMDKDIDIMTSLAQHLNFTYNVTIVSDGTGHGIEVEPGKFNGIIGYLQRKEADVSVQQVGQTPARSKILRFLTPVMDAHADFFLLQPSLATSLGYLLPFTANVWLVSAVAAISMTFALAAFELFSPHPSGDRVRRNKDEKVVAPSRKAYWLLTAGFMDDVFQSPNGPSVRILLGSLLFGTLIIFVHYTANFTSFLTADDAKLPFTTMEEAIANPEYELSILRTNTLLYEKFKNSKGGVYKDFWQKLASNNFKGVVSSKEEGIQIISTGKYTLFTMAQDIKYRLREQCSIIDLNRLKYLKARYGSATRKDFPYFTLLTSTIQRFHEGGLFYRMHLKYFAKENPYCKKEKTMISFSIGQVSILLFLLLGAYVSAMTVLLIEIFLKNCTF